MIGFRNRQKITIATSLAAVMMLTACAGINERVAAIGKPPVMTEIKNPYSEEGYKPVALPMPPQAAMNTQANSLWQSSRQTFFKDQRANKVGDILTVMIDISDEADMKNKTERKRSGNDEVGVDKFLGS
jgi:flagellar L-ring protein precursor FlgH